MTDICKNKLQHPITTYYHIAIGTGLSTVDSQAGGSPLIGTSIIFFRLTCLHFNSLFLGWLFAPCTKTCTDTHYQKYTAHTHTHTTHPHPTHVYGHHHHHKPQTPSHSVSCNARPYVLVHTSKWESWHTKNTTSASCR